MHAKCATVSQMPCKTDQSSLINCMACTVHCINCISDYRLHMIALSLNYIISHLAVSFGGWDFHCSLQVLSAPDEELEPWRGWHFSRLVAAQQPPQWLQKKCWPGRRGQIIVDPLCACGRWRHLRRVRRWSKRHDMKEGVWLGADVLS